MPSLNQRTSPLAHRNKTGIGEVALDSGVAPSVQGNRSRLKRIDIQMKGGYYSDDYFSLRPPEVIDGNNTEGLQLVLPCDDPQGTTDQNCETE